MPNNNIPSASGPGILDMKTLSTSLDIELFERTHTKRSNPYMLHLSRFLCSSSPHVLTQSFSNLPYAPTALVLCRFAINFVHQLALSSTRSMIRLKAYEFLKKKINYYYYLELILVLISLKKKSLSASEE